MKNSNNLFFGNGTPPADSKITGSLNSNPIFRSLTKLDFHWTEDSPALEAAVAIKGLATDLDGVKRPPGEAFGIGAYEACEE